MKSSPTVSEESQRGMAVGKFQRVGWGRLKEHCCPVLVGSRPQGVGDISGQLLRGFPSFEKSNELIFPNR